MEIKGSDEGEGIHLAQEVLISRGCMIETGCHLCSKNIVETKNHIMFMWDCVYARIFWTDMMAQYNISNHGGMDILTILARVKLHLS